jgi:hypothetical protein
VGQFDCGRLPGWNMGRPGRILWMVRDHWVEKLKCRRCGKIGTAELSADDQSWTIKVDSIPKGFQFIQSEDGSNFYCSFCELPVDP